MIKVFIPGKQVLPIWRQFKVKNKFIWGNCEFFFEECNDYDYIVVIDSLSLEISTNTPKSKRLLFLGEPPLVKHYTTSFRNQFGSVYSCQEKLITKGVAVKSNPILPWMLGCSLKENTHSCNSDLYLCYSDFTNMNNAHTINKACLITSNKTFTEGHRNRVCFADYVIAKDIDFIDVYGNGYKSIPDKLDVLSKYKYSVIIENCSYPNYWTEKLADCYLSGSYPLYHGAPNIDEYFSKESYTPIDIRNMDETIDIIRDAIEQNLYNQRRQAVRDARNLVLNKYNMFAQISDYIEILEEENSSLSILEKSDKIYPMRYSFYDKIRNQLMWKFNI